MLLSQARNGLGASLATTRQRASSYNEQHLSSRLLTNSNFIIETIKKVPAAKAERKGRKSSPKQSRKHFGNLFKRSALSGC